jgi:hypothetical protein
MNKLDSGACPGPDPGFAGMTENGLLELFTNASVLMRSQKPENIIPFMVRYLTMNGRTVRPEVSKDEQGERGFLREHRS